MSRKTDQYCKSPIPKICSLSPTLRNSSYGDVISEAASFSVVCSTIPSPLDTDGNRDKWLDRPPWQMAIWRCPPPPAFAEGAGPVMCKLPNSCSLQPAQSPRSSAKCRTANRSAPGLAAQVRGTAQCLDTRQCITGSISYSLTACGRLMQKKA